MSNVRPQKNTRAKNHESAHLRKSRPATAGSVSIWLAMECASREAQRPTIKMGKSNLTPQNAQAARPPAGGSPTCVHGNSVTSDITGPGKNCTVRVTQGQVAPGCALNVLVSESVPWLIQSSFPTRQKRAHGGCGLTLRSS